ncbi:EF-hand calcium-binding site containing protein [Babesia ovis]|uniref:EF-hand calcium-binding site containing protein n=1 Tax=Babesia ovis TaxID=5869 RepID=A0A9W5T8Z5_BABOV|nr:EF-hand calcium-binding site containing protein [Babesia ovis]
MQWESRFAEAFLCCDSQKTGHIMGPDCAKIYQSLGLGLSREQCNSCPAMNKDQFVQYGMKLVNDLPQDGGLQKLFDAIKNPQSNSIGTAELKEVMTLMKNRSPQELEEALKIMDPKNSGRIDFQSFVNVFTQ